MILRVIGSMRDPSTPTHITIYRILSICENMQTREARKVTLSQIEDGIRQTPVVIRYITKCAE